MHQRAYACKHLDIRSWKTKLVLNYSIDGGKLLKLHVDELKFDDDVDDLHLGVVAQATDDMQDEDENFAAAASMLKSYSHLKPKKKHSTTQQACRQFRRTCAASNQAKAQGRYRNC
jgi:hypothetical protein